MLNHDADMEMLLADMRFEFIEETRDRLERVEWQIRQIESRQGKMEDTLLELKRDIHSVKGSAAPFGFPIITKIAHGLEDYLETTGDVTNVAAEDLRVFIDTIMDVLDSGGEPDDQLKEMMLKGLPSGRTQNGRKILSRGTIVLLMPKGVQRKIIGQELAQLGFMVTILGNPVEAIDTILVLKPDFMITTMVQQSLSGLELARVFSVIESTKKLKVAILSSSVVGENDVPDNLPEMATLIHKGPYMTRNLLAFINT
ncbi:MAG: Hpt domain-containing protein [Rhodospirillales bacterium]|nr:Hpt domain-containing protein [Rhodospirillales bacterium]